jgi:hypothetical protein
MIYQLRQSLNRIVRGRSGGLFREIAGYEKVSIHYGIWGRLILQEMLPLELEFNSKQLMPDLYELQNDYFIISSRLKLLLEEHCPACIKFLPIGIKFNPEMNPADAYFFMNILSRARNIDWSTTPTTARVRKDGMKSYGHNLSDGPLRFKKLPSDCPMIWKEEGYELNGEFFNAPLALVFFKHELWLAVEASFPGLLDANIHDEAAR